jgi:metallo-beta-lactamase family protein
VDCGLFQGPRETRERNVTPLPFDAAALDFAILTHAHLDHSGLLPRLCAEGFNGPVYATAATRDLASVMLPDSALVMADEPKPYGLDEVRAVLRQFREVPYESEVGAANGVSFRLRNAGHILGSAFVEMTLTERGMPLDVVVSGDLGLPGRPIVRDPARPRSADVLLLESTYGDRTHPPLDQSLEALTGILRRALEDRDGVVLVPAFAVGRTQDLLYHLNKLCRSGALRNLEVFVDSPLATEVTEITARHPELFDEETRRTAAEPALANGGMRVTYTASVEESKALNHRTNGAIILAGSGMCEGGRIRHHLRRRLSDPRTTILFIGYQAVGTLGRALAEGAPNVRILGDDIVVRARIVKLDGFSAHADQPALTGWVSALPRPPRQFFLVHGEAAAYAALADRIKSGLGWHCRIARYGEVVTL